MNIINAVDQAHTMGGEVIGLSGFRADNTLKSKCDISLYVDVENYGVVECLHHTLLHIILDEYAN